MHRFRLRDINTLFTLLVMSAMACLAGFVWHDSIATQRMRTTAILVNREFRLLVQFRESLEEDQHRRLDFRRTGAGADLAVYQAAHGAASSRIEALSAELEQCAAADPAAAPMLLDLVRQVGARQTALARKTAIGPGLPPEDDVVTARLAAALQAVNSTMRISRDAVTGGIQKLRWLAAIEAVLGIVGVLSMLRLISRAWRRLIRAETEQRAAALQLRSSLDSLSQGVAVFDAGGSLLNWNMRLGQLLDLPPAMLRRRLAYDGLEQHLASGAGAFLEPLETIRADTLLSRDGGTTGIRPVVYERAVHRSDGLAETQLEIRRTLMPQGGFVLTLTNMTEHARAQRMLHEAQKMQALGQLTGGIAHDFNNILTVILGSLDVGLAEAASVDSQQQLAVLSERMRRAARAAENGAALVRQLLAFARKQPLAPAPIDFEPVLSELVPLLHHTIGDSIVVKCEVEPGLWPVMTDAGQLESAVLNLVLNARDAMPQGGRLIIGAGNVTLGRDTLAHPDLKPGDYVRITVTDTGTGMSRHVIEHAFEPFFTTKPEGSGTGLGLAMVFSFARQSGGLAMIHSETDAEARTGSRAVSKTIQGTTITLYLPRALAYPASGAAVLAGSLPSVGHGRASQPRILVVEDDPLVREIAAEILRDLGYRVTEAPDAELALRLMDTQESPVDLLLTDIMLPGRFDGRALAARVQQASPTTRILYMSGSLEAMPPVDGELVDGEPVDAELVDGEIQWIGKPFRSAQLAAKVDALIGNRYVGQAAA